MIAGAVVVLLLVILWNIPVGVVAEYTDGGATVKAKVSFLRFLLYPREKKEKTEKQHPVQQPPSTKPEEPPEKKETVAPDKAAAPVKKSSSATTAVKKSVPSDAAVSKQDIKPVSIQKSVVEEPKPSEERKSPDVKDFLTGGNIPLFRELLGLALEALGRIRRKLTMNELTLYLSLGGFGDDPASSAMLYAKAWAAIGALTPILENTFTICHRDIQASVDFTSMDNWIYGLAELTLKLGEIIMIALYYGLRGLRIFLKIKKGGKKNGTSDQ